VKPVELEKPETSLCFAGRGRFRLQNRRRWFLQGQGYASPGVAVKGKSRLPKGRTMNIDIRLQVSFRDHPKRIKLGRRLGAAGALALIDLLLSVAQSKPDGLLCGWSDDDMAIAARWDGEPEEFVSALVELRFLDRDEDGSYSIHDWTEHNGYAAGAPDRSERARAAAHARWDRQTQNATIPLGNAESCYPHCCPHSSALPIHAGSNAPTTVPTSIRKSTHSPEHPPTSVDDGIGGSLRGDTHLPRNHLSLSARDSCRPAEACGVPTPSPPDNQLHQVRSKGCRQI